MLCLFLVYLVPMADYFQHYNTWEKALAEKKDFSALVLAYEELKNVSYSFCLPVLTQSVQCIYETQYFIDVECI